MAPPPNIGVVYIPNWTNCFWPNKVKQANERTQWVEKIHLEAFAVTLPLDSFDGFALIHAVFGDGCFIIRNNVRMVVVTGTCIMQHCTIHVERRSGKGEEFDFVSVAEIKRHSTSRTAAGTRKKGSPVQRRATYIVNPQNTKSDSHERQQDSGQVSKSDSHERQQDSDHVDMPRQQSVSGTYWDSPEAYKLFKPRQCGSNCLSAVERRIKLLQRAQQFEGWRDLVHGRDPDNVCSNYDKLVIRQKSMFILKAYQIAILEMNRKTWLECCEIAVHEINLLGVTLTTRGDNLSRWHRLFRTREAFLHPNLEARVGRDPLPPFLRMFPDAATKIKQFCRVNLLNLNVETVHQFILNKVFPRIYAVWASEQKAVATLSNPF
ncbi:hypothetical protein IV203_028335 [Nitzschia inconspicua]|uniref:Uncharacterized protein n=1 Tax=Nitzschia inconspicua TaxID=303405 RepID=A0A9K3K8K6_9STRA|nr:hypothetical protein IV203_028335 [Nitzschia inconspicua]